jgi:hypothetical protein
MSSDAEAAGHAANLWRNGRPSRAAVSDATDELYGVTKPEVIEDFLRERALDGLFDERDDEAESS